MNNNSTVSWRDLTLYGFDVAECSAERNPREFVEALREWRSDGTMVGMYFSERARDAGPDEDADALDARPEIDWMGFEEFAETIA